jgi:hypothetical protein
MKYTLITSKGKVFIFNVKACAESFQQAYGGSIVTDEIWVDKKPESLYNSSIEQQGV